MISEADQTSSTAHQTFCLRGTGAKRPEREVKYPLPPNAEIRNEWSCTCTPHACLFVAGRNRFTFFFCGRFFSAMCFYCFRHFQFLVDLALLCVFLSKVLIHWFLRIGRQNSKYPTPYAVYYVAYAYIHIKICYSSCTRQMWAGPDRTNCFRYSGTCPVH